MDFSAYLASSSEEEEAEEQAGVVGRGNGKVVSEEEQIQKYRVSWCGVVKLMSACGYDACFMLGSVGGCQNKQQERSQGGSRCGNAVHMECRLARGLLQWTAWLHCLNLILQLGELVYYHYF